MKVFTVACVTTAPTSTSVQFRYRVGTAVIQRKIYFMDGTAVAARSGDLNKDNNALFYTHTDHLGPTGLMSDAE